MKQILRRTAWVGILALGISTQVFAEGAGPSEPHDFKSTAEQIQRRELELKLLPNTVPQYRKITEAQADKVKVEVVPTGGSTTEREVSKEAFAQIQLSAETGITLRAELAACTGKNDLSAKRLAELMDKYYELIQDALFDKKGLNGRQTAKQQADEKSFVTVVSQIRDILLKRGSVLPSDTYSPFATELEKKFAESQLATLSLLLGDDQKPLERLANFSRLAQAADTTRFADSVQKTDQALGFLKTADAGDLCRLGTPPSQVREDRTRAMVKNSNKEEDSKTETQDDKKQNQPADPFAEFKKYISDQQAAFAEQTQKGIDAFNAQVDALLKSQKKAEETAKLDDSKKQTELMKQLLAAQKEKDANANSNAKPNPLASLLQPSAQPGGGGGNGGGQDPYQQQMDQSAMMAQQQAMQQQQANPFAGVMQAMMMQQMMNPQGTQNASLNTPPAIYQLGPSNRWDSIFGNTSNSPATGANSQALQSAMAQGGQQAQQELLNALRQAAPQSAANAYGPQQQQQGYGPQQQGYGPQQGYGQGGPMSSRLFSQSRVSSRRNQVNTSGFAQLNAISGPAQLSGSPLGRTSTIPSDLMPGGGAAGLTF